MPDSIEENNEQYEENNDEYEEDNSEIHTIHSILENSIPYNHINVVNKFFDIQQKIFEIMEDEDLSKDLRKLSSGVINIYMLVCDILYQARIYFKRMNRILDYIPIELLSNSQYCFSKIKIEYNYFMFEVMYLNIFFNNLLLQMESESIVSTSDEMFRIYNILIE